MAVLVTLSFMVIAGMSAPRLGASSENKPIVGGLTAVEYSKVTINNGKPISPYGDPGQPAVSRTNQLHPHDEIKAATYGKVWFVVQGSRKASIWCETYQRGKYPGDLIVAPKQGVLLQVKSGGLDCSTSKTPGLKEIMLSQVTMKTVDPTFNALVSKPAVRIRLTAGIAYVSGKNRKPRKLVAPKAKKPVKGVKPKPPLKAAQVVVPTGGNPQPPKTVTLPPSDATGLANIQSVQQIATSPIAFESNRSGKYEIYTLDPDAAGATPKLLTDTGSVNVDPAWSPDVTKIAFESDRAGGNTSEIYVMNADGTKPVRLTRNPATDRAPTWSPDGKSIAFASNRTGEYEIYTMNAATGGGLRQLTSGSQNDEPTWSPDGKQIAFRSDRDGNTEIYVMPAAGGKPTRLTTNAAGDISPAWSPDGKKLAFVSNRDGNNQIYVMNADGTKPLRLTKNAFDDSNPTWSPDGLRIAFSSDRDGNDEIYVMNADGTGQRRITTSPKSDLAPTW